MASIVRVKLKWTGFSGAPGYSNFFYRDDASGAPTQTTADDAVAKVLAFGGAVRSHLPAEVSLQIQNDVEVLEETNGQLVNVLNVTAPPSLPGEMASAPYSAASGGVVTWRTGGVLRGRRVRGRTFLVPLASAAYQNDGTIAPAVLTSLNTNFQSFISDTNSAILGVYCRPSAKGASDGAWFQVTSFSVPDKVAVLRSRRD